MSNALYELLDKATQDKPVCRYQYQLKTGKPERQFRKEGRSAPETGREGGDKPREKRLLDSLRPRKNT